MLKCIIVDDEPLAQDVLEEHLKQDNQLQLAAKFHNAFDAIRFLQKNDVDVLFLDIQMHEMTGIELLKFLSRPPLTVFTTAFRDYAFEGFELGVIDFLLKPISYNRFRLSLEKIKEFISLRSEGANLDVGNSTPEFIFVKSGVQKIKLYFKEVSHIQGLKDYAIIHTSGKRIVIKGSVKSMLDIFPAVHFIRVHKSFIVAKDKITRIEKNRIIINNHQVPIGRYFKEDVGKIVSGI